MRLNFGNIIIRDVPFTIEEITIDGNKFMVLKPIVEMEDYDYDKLKPIIERYGGHWRERAEGFVFAEDKEQTENYATWKEDIQFFPTPREVAKRMVELSGVEDYAYNERPVILEPSAGHGALLDALPEYVRKTASFYIVEPEEINIEFLMQKGYLPDQMKFETFYSKHIKEAKFVSHVIMNPPFSHGRDIAHIKLAYELLKQDGVLVAIAPENSLYYKNGTTEEFKKWLKDVNAYIEPVPYGSFKESGTAVDTVIIKIVKE